MSDPIHLDYHATTPVAPEVFDAMLPWLRGEFGNPSSAHPDGRRGAQAAGAVRLSVERMTTTEEVERAATGLIATWQRLRSR